ncbi:transposase [Streptomyces sp. 5-6(2022)]|uniref:transposase n=1 Tax=Streptomyces sp. 5-6(2022) TaxID=2936510 RepID=UPI0023B89F86|nr:transposase [Streptomyces sp. 5-6(2022)]
MRDRIAWKYLLGLELTDPGFDFSVLSEFRARLLTGSAERRVLTRILAVCQEAGLLERGGPEGRTGPYGLHPCPGRSAYPQPVGAHRGNCPGRAQCPGRGGPEVAGGVDAPGLGRALRPSGGELPAAAESSGASRLRPESGRRWCRGARHGHLHGYSWMARPGGSGHGAEESVAAAVLSNARRPGPDRKGTSPNTAVPAGLT